MLGGMKNSYFSYLENYASKFMDILSQDFPMEISANT
jgi:hypothetical protein